MTIRILLAGQNQKNTALVKSALAQLDVDIIAAPGVSLALFLAKKNLPVLVISDLELLDGDGLSLMREIAADPQLKAMPFIFLLSNRPAPALQKRLLEGGAQEILLNGCKPEELLAALGELVWQDNVHTEKPDNETTE